MKSYTRIVSAMFVLLIPVFMYSQIPQKVESAVRFDHIRINVPDKDATAKWYVENGGLEILPSTDNRYVYVADPDHNCMLELSSIPGIKNTYGNIVVDGFHIAFEGHRSIQVAAEKMLAKGATQQGVLYTNQIGDYVMNIKDPNGFNVQMIHRVNPFYAKAVKGNLRFEHFAFNIPDQKTAALWYAEFMGLLIPWSKDIDKVNFTRNYRVPYVGDAGGKMSMELFSNNIECSLSNQPHEVVHIAFLTEEPDKLAERLVYGGAITVNRRVEANGDVIIDLYDPNKIPIRLMKRTSAVLH